jgi:uncharacterized membrane protein
MDDLFSGAHAHLLINHVPILGAVFAFCFFGASFVFAPDVLRRVALVFLVMTALAAAAADLTGDAAEDAVRGLPGVRRDDIHAHTQMAAKAYAVAGVTGVLALAALVGYRRKPVPGNVTVAMVVVSAFLSGAMAYTGLVGGRIRHTEVRPGATAADAAVVETKGARQAPGP